MKLLNYEPDDNSVHILDIVHKVLNVSDRTHPKMKFI
jgi:hypothetical protein